MKPFFSVGMFVQRGAIEFSQTVSIFREVARHPIQQQANAGIVACIHELSEFIGRAVANCWRIKADRLVSPGSIEWKLGDRHQFNVGESHVAHVIDQLCCVLEIGQGSVAIFRHPLP